jgi:Fuc2NAc and GlcNAc transferase
MTLGLLAIVTTLDGGMTLWAWLILLGVFVIDATTTLIRRILSKKPWYEAHRSHAYQILSRYYGSHKRVTSGVLTINIVWLLPMAFSATEFPYWGWLICLAAWSPLFLVAILVGAGRADSTVVDP